MKKSYRLDNNAKYYPAVTKKSNSCVFRISAILTEQVDSNVLWQAASIIIKRFPTMAVKLKKGLFWVYFYENDNPLVVQEESNHPCAPIMGIKENNDYLFKIMYFERRITLECFHALTDGMGAMEFLKTLVYQYLLLTGKDVQDEGLIMLPQSIPEQQEEEDGYLRYYQKGVKGSRSKLKKSSKARLIKGTVLKEGRMNVIHGVIPAAPLADYARLHGTTITGYLVTVFAQAIASCDSQLSQSHRPVRIGIPVNLRGMFPTKTMRNFVYQTSVSLPEDSRLTFDERLESVRTQMKTAITKEHLSERINTFVGYEKMIAGRIFPWFIKKVAIDIAAKWSEGAITALLTNLGNIRLPKSMERYVDIMEAVPSQKKGASINCGVCSVNGKLNIAFSTNIVETVIIRRFFDMVSEQTGLEVGIYSNDRMETR